MGRAVRAISEDQLHVTLKFYGDVPFDRIPQISLALDAACAMASEFDWSIQGLGAFPSAARPSVVWGGVRDGETMTALAGSISAESEQRGFASERRPFHPHVTLARVRFRPPALAELIRDSRNDEYGTQHTSEVVLFSSTLGTSGSVYTRLHTARLARK